jgi:Glycolipid transfer protein (GLTP)
MGFEFEKMVAAFEAVQCASGWDNDAPRLPLAEPFLDAMCEVAQLFDHLGGGFTFVRRDIAAKVAILRAHLPAAADLTTTVEAELASGIAGAAGKDSGKVWRKGAATLQEPPTATRTLLRLMWATRFIDVLLRELSASFAAESGSDVSSEVSLDGGGKGRSGLRIGTLREAVCTAYDEALAPHHSWTVRRTVAAACYLLPSKEIFVDKLGVDLSRRDEYFRRVDASLSPLVARMYAFYTLHDIHNLP